jgi:hypothetical protein
MKAQKIVLVLAGLIAALALLAAGAGVLTAVFWQPGGDHFAFTTLRGETIQIQGGGLYRYDTVTVAAQAIAQDLVTLVLGIPLLIVAMVLAARGSLRGKVLLTGTLGYFLYTYTSIAMMTAYNELFLLYVVLFSLSLFAFVLSLLAVDVATLPAHISERFPRRTIAGVALAIGVLLTLLWLGRLVPPLLAGTPPFGLESYATLVIQVMDLGIIAPTAILTGVLLLRREPLGYVLAAVIQVFGVSMGAAVTAMLVGQALAGVPLTLAEIVIFPTLALVNIALIGLLLRSISEHPVAAQGTPAPSPTLRPGAYLPTPHKG